MIRAESTVKKGELATAEVIKAEFDRFSIPCQIDRWDNNRANVSAKISSTNQKTALLLAAHLDVVPPGDALWKHNPFAGIEENGKIYGRGSADMKGSTAAVITAITELVAEKAVFKGDLIFVGAAGEETDSCGAKRFIEQNKDNFGDIAAVIIPEPTNFDIITAHRGIVWLRVTTLGKTAHGSMPQEGINAIYSMNAFLTELRSTDFGIEHPLFGKCSVSVNTINSGNAINVIPDKCQAQIDIRIVPGQTIKSVIAEVEKIFARLKQQDSTFDAKVEVIRHCDGLDTDPKSDFVRKFCEVVENPRTKTVGYTTDGPCFASLGAPVIIYGAGVTELCHKPDEYIDIADLEKGKQVYKKIFREFLC
ncbi:MAG: M20 family metallopeptidase [Phycisphaerae bacterium]|nr:M20 family metallopeptidase [Phycisphaerae bacterium]